MDRLDAAADALAATPLGQMDAADLQRWAVDFPAPPAPQPVPPLLAGRTVAVARDAAFGFIYPANLDTLAQLGAQVRFFSPLAGDACRRAMPWLPGGYPELHAAQLAAHHGLQNDLCAHWAAGKPLNGPNAAACWRCSRPCACRMAVSRRWGLLPGSSHAAALASLGPRQIDLAARCCAATAFITPLPTAAPRCWRAAKPGGQDADGEPLYAHGSLRASYFHAWFASNPVAVAQLLGGAA